MKKKSNLKKKDYTGLIHNVLSRLKSSLNWEEMVRDIVSLVQKETGFESVGIRLHDGTDYPYYFTSGFTAEFVQKEMFLCERDKSGQLCVDHAGNPYLDCMCGNIICGKTDASLEFFSDGGSFWTNSTSDLLAKTTEKDRQSRTRNRCNGEGYESVALVPIRNRDTVFGLLQLNDRRRDRLDNELICILEGVGISIAIVFCMIKPTLQSDDKNLDVNQHIKASISILEDLYADLKKKNIARAKQLDYFLSLQSKQGQFTEEFDSIKDILVRFG